MGIGDGNSGGPLDKLYEYLENRAVLLIVATMMGIGGQLAVVSAVPEVVRPDAHTAADDRRARQEDRVEMIKFVNDVKAAIEQRQQLLLAPHVEHLKKSEEGWRLIYQMSADVRHLRDEVNRLRTHLEDHNRKRQE